MRQMTAIQQKFFDEAMRLGAVHAQIFTLDDIVFDPRTLIKCMYGCDDWGKGNTCPSRAGNLSLAEWRDTLSHYKWGVIIHCHEAKLNQDISFELERQAFFAGYYFAFSMSDCKLCASCAGHAGHTCLHPGEARPAFHSVGIDVFATARRFSLPIETLEHEGEQQNWYAAVFVE
ncbi:MAG: DUF2284 domain-containing protein [Clostridiales bacterium]|nr:DUF2284 domain-containing protein [Clostridiales bacterium]